MVCLHYTPFFCLIRCLYIFYYAVLLFYYQRLVEVSAARNCVY